MRRVKSETVIGLDFGDRSGKTVCVERLGANQKGPVCGGRILKVEVCLFG